MSQLLPGPRGIDRSGASPGLRRMPLLPSSMIYPSPASRTRTLRTVLHEPNLAITARPAMRRHHRPPSARTMAAAWPGWERGRPLATTPPHHHRCHSSCSATQTPRRGTAPKLQWSLPNPSRRPRSRSRRPHQALHSRDCTPRRAAAASRRQRPPLIRRIRSHPFRRGTDHKDLQLAAIHTVVTTPIT